MPQGKFILPVVEPKWGPALCVGRGVARAIATAVIVGSLLAIGMTHGAMADRFEDGAASFRNGDTAGAIKVWKASADQGDRRAQNALGFVYYFGMGVAEDAVEAAKWFRKAAQQGLPAAQEKLGEMYYDGKGVPKDFAEAARWYQMAANQGLASAQYGLGLLYDSGEGVPQNYSLAVRWYRAAAEQGNPGAQSNLGAMYVIGRGVPQDYVQAAKWRRRGAEQGEGFAQCALGTMYESGQGVPRNLVLAHKWYNLSVVAHQNPEARENCLELRDHVAGEISAAQIAEAQRLASEWRSKTWPEVQAMEAASGPTPRKYGTPESEPSSKPSDGIAAAQEALRQLGFDPGPSDGVVGPKTREAVKAFERANGLPETGEITPKLIQEMSKAFYKQT